MSPVYKSNRIEWFWLQVKDKAKVSPPVILCQIHRRHYLLAVNAFQGICFSGASPKEKQCGRRVGKRTNVRSVLWRVWEMQLMDKMILFRACGNLILSDACFWMVIVRQLLLVGTVLYIWYTTKVSSLCTVLTQSILDRALGFIYWRMFRVWNQPSPLFLAAKYSTLT
jgi:hypothetical protein